MRKSQKKTTTWAVIIAIFVVLGLWWTIKLEQIANPESSVSALSEIAGVEEPVKESEDSGFLGRVFGTNSKSYRDSSAKFSFSYPKEYEIKEIPPIAEGEGKAVLLSKENSAPSIQITVSDFDEDIVLTIDRIKQDVPDLLMNNAREFIVNSSIKGVAFSDSVGVNIWFVARKHLFQVSAFSSDIETLDKILSSLSF